MPRHERAEIYYTCGHCAMTDTELALRLGDEYDAALKLEGPGWELLILEEEWFCSTDCFIAWLVGKINEAEQEPARALEEDARDEYISGWDVYGGLTA